jgi:hypothetical protein
LGSSGGRPKRFGAAAKGLAAVLSLAVLSFATGCGEGTGVEAGATVRVYAAPALCAQAEGALRAGGAAGDVRLAVRCLAPVQRGGRVDLATAGENAREATEDSTAIAYLETPNRAAPFAQPIVEEAGIAWIETTSGTQAMRQVMQAVEEAGSGSLRDEVRSTLESE